MPKRQPAPPTDPLDRARQQLEETDRDIEEIAREAGSSNRKALDQRLRKRFGFGVTSRALRTGVPTARGRPATGRDVRWVVRFVPDEWTEVEAAILRERDAGAATDGEALLSLVRRAGSPRKRRG